MSYKPENFGKAWKSYGLKCQDHLKNSLKFYAQFSEDTDNIREGLGQLRACLPPQDPQQLTIDTLERSISEMMSRLLERAGSPSGKKSRRHVSVCALREGGGSGHI